MSGGREGGREWREGVEGGREGGREWREGGSGGREWREGVEGGREWREGVEGVEGGREIKKRGGGKEECFVYSSHSSCFPHHGISSCTVLVLSLWNRVSPINNKQKIMEVGSKVVKGSGLSVSTIPDVCI